MSTLLEEIIADLKAKRLDYQEYLKNIAILAKQVQSGQADNTPEVLKNSPGLRAIYNNLSALPETVEVGAVSEDPVTYTKPDERKLELAVEIHDTVLRVKPDEWRGHQARENEIKRALLPLLKNDASAVEEIFLIIKRQNEY
jgi:type I restriction enzyme R subunit